MPKFVTVATDLGHGIHKEAYEYWRSKVPGAGILPGRQHIDPLDIPRILPWIMLIEAHPNGDTLRFRFRLVGTGNVNLYRRDATGLWFDEAYEGDILKRQIDDYSTVVQNRLPTLAHRSLPISGREFVAYDRLLLPLAADGHEVDMVMVVTVFSRH